MRLPAPMVALGLAMSAGMAASPASPAGVRTVPCGDVIASTPYQYVGDDRPGYRYRRVLGVVAAPPAYMRGVAPSGEQPWSYWRKQGLVVRATRLAVTVTVPERWRTRAAISWGGSGGPVSSLRFEGCGGPPDVGHAYAGGFYLRSPSACVPLVFAVGRRSATVRFGLDQRCRP